MFYKLYLYPSSPTSSGHPFLFAIIALAPRTADLGFLDIWKNWKCIPVHLPAMQTPAPYGCPGKPLRRHSPFVKKAKPYSHSLHLGFLGFCFCSAVSIAYLELPTSIHSFVSSLFAFFICNITNTMHRIFGSAKVWLSVLVLLFAFRHLLSWIWGHSPNTLITHSLPGPIKIPYDTHIVPLHHYSHSSISSMLSAYCTILNPLTIHSRPSIHPHLSQIIHS